MFQVVPVHQSDPRHRTKIFNRILAKLIDLLIVFVVAKFVLYPIGPLFGFIYSVFGDAIPFNQGKRGSLGKRLFGFCVVHVLDKRPAHWKDSLLRNAPVGVATFFAIIPLWGWLIAGFVGLPLMLIEVYLIATVESGHRIGDVMADTEVVEVQSHSGV